MPEAARRLGVSQSSIRRRVKDRSIPALRVGRRVLVDVAAVRPKTEGEIIRLARGAREH